MSIVATLLLGSILLSCSAPTPSEINDEFTGQDCVYFDRKPYQRFLEWLKLNGTEPRPPRSETYLKVKELQEKFHIKKGDFKFESIGPAPITSSFNYISKSTGRANVIVVHPENTDIWYAGTALGGVFKTEDSGKTWVATQDSMDYPLFPIGSIAIAPSNPDIVYAGTGDLMGMGHFAGEGILKSTDSGVSWKLMGKEQFRNTAITKIIVHPRHPNIIMALARVGLDAKCTPYYSVGYPGLYLSHDSGENFKQVRAFTFPWGILYSPKKDIIYAIGKDILGNARLQYSTDWGASWDDANLNLGYDQPFDVVTTMAMPTKDPDLMYAIIGNRFFGSIYRFNLIDHENITVAKLPDLPKYRNKWHQLNWFNQALAVDPRDSNLIYAGGVEIFEGNPTTELFWTRLDPKPEAKLFDSHADQHDFTWVEGKFLVANDGGIFRREEDGTWNSRNDDLPITQFWKGAVSNFNYAIGGTQDVGTPIFWGDGSRTWRNLGEGDGFSIISGPTPNLFGTTAQNNQIRRTQVISKNDKKPRNTYLYDGNDFNDEEHPFHTLLAQCPDNINVVAFRTNKHIYETHSFFDLDSEVEWDAIADIVRFGEIRSMTYAPNTNCDRLLVGNEDSEIKLINKNGSETFWERPFAHGSITDIEIVPTKDDPKTSWVFTSEGGKGFWGNAYVAVNQLDENGFRNWFGFQSITPDLGVPIYDLAYSAPHDILFAGSDIGMLMLLNPTDCSLNSVECDWIALGPESGMPNLPIMSVSLSPNKDYLIAFTHGRGAYEMDLPLPN